MSADDLGGVRAAFSDQARSCRDLGSVLTAQIMETLGTALQADQGAVARRVLDWPGDTSSRGASVPLRLAGALHAQVLLGQAPALAAAYAKGEAPAALLLQTIAAHEAEILAWLNQTPQTNEVGRAAALIAGARFALVQLGTPLPLALRELGASAGLNLNFPDYTIDCHGSSEPPAMLSPDWRGEVPPQIALVAPNRRGLWAHAEHTPFGHGQPYSPGQVTRLLERHLFRAERRDSALYVPPFRPFLRMAGAWETVGRAVWPARHAGLAIVEARKELLAATPAGVGAVGRVVMPA